MNCRNGMDMRVARLICFVMLAVALVGIATDGVAGQAAGAKPDPEAPVRLAQFRQWVAEAHAASTAPAKKGAPAPPPVDFRPADEVFLRLLTLQARAAAARQSQDRLAGWNAAIKPRVENQSIAALDVEVLTLAEKKAASEVAQLESELRRAVERANALAGRAPGVGLLAMVDGTGMNSSDTEGLAAMEKDVLVRGRDLLVKMFQSFTVGGVEVAELLWYEKQATEAEMNYRLWLAQAGFEAAVKAVPAAR